MEPNNDEVGLQTLEVISKADFFNRWMYAQIKPHLGNEILEIGSGIGNISDPMVKDGFLVTLSDYNRQYCELLKKKYQSAENVQAILSIDLQHPTFANEYAALEEKFQTVFLLNVIEHLEDDTRAVENCKFLLKKTGKLILLAPAYPFLFCKFDKELGHYRRYTTATLAGRMERAGLTIVEKKYFNFAGIFGWFLFGKLLQKKSIGGTEMSIFNSFGRLLNFADWITANSMGLSAIAVGQK